MNFYEQIFSRGRATGEGMTHFERLFAAKFGGSPAPEVREYTGAVPATIIADGTPLLDYLISGNTTQNGTPTPDNPVMPEGTGERTGNLADVIRGKVPRISDGSLVTFDGLTTEYVPFHTGDILSVSFDKPGSTKQFYVFYYSGDTLLSTKDLVYGTTITSYGVPETVDRIRIRIDYSGFEVSNVMLNTGSTALPYENFGYKIPILSANTTTPVYLGEVETTRKIKKYEFTGSETWNVGSENFYSLVPETSSGDGVPYSSVICSHCSGSTINGTGKALFVKKSEFPNITTGAELKQFCADQYAAGTPVCVWYVLATETTGIVNEPLMRIGDYADTVSKEQAGVNIPTNNGSTTVDVDTTLKPSEVYIKYMG